MNDEPLLRQHFDRLVGLGENERAVQLARLAAKVPVLADRLRRLLAHADEIGDALDRTPSLADRDGRAPSSDEDSRAAKGPSAAGVTEERIGPYVIRERIGSGGFGEVFRAERPDLYGREVAIKILKAGLDSRAIVARFRREMESLARMDSPHIAAVLEAGTTPAGRPFFVMELIRGQHITRFCDERRLSLRERLTLFLQVCEAVQHAHLKGVFHRDIKPSNVLASDRDGKPFAQVIDFGIAKAAGPTGSDPGVIAPGDATLAGQPVGTVGYMSPEQVEGSPDIDARTDVYSLGVLLYELLTGVTPLERAGLRHAPLVEILRHLREHDAPRPGTSLRAGDPVLVPIAAARATAPTRLVASLRGDLDWILAKALEPDRERRFASVSELAADIDRHLCEQPVLAGPPTKAYRVRKFVRRYRAYVVGAALALAALCAGLVGTMIGLARARDAERVATRRLADAEFIAAFQRQMLESMSTQASGKELVEDMLLRVDEALVAGGTDEATRTARLDGLRRDLALMNATDVAAAMIDRAIVAPAVAGLDRYEVEPTIAIRMRRTLGLAYAQLGRLPTAVALLERGLDESLLVNGPEHVESLDLRDHLAVQYRDMGDVERAESLLRASLAARERTQGADHPDRHRTLALLAATLHQRRAFAEASSAAAEALAGLLATLGEADPVTIDAMRWAAETAMAEGRLEDAERHVRQGLDAVGTLVEAGTPEGREAGLSLRLRLQSAMATLLMRQGRYGEVADPMQVALDGFRATLGDDHPTTLRSISNLGAVYSVIGRLAESETLLREAHQRLTVLRGEDHPDAIAATSNLARVLQMQGRLGEAFPFHERAYRRARIVLGENDPRVLAMGGNLGAALLMLDRAPEADPILRDVHERRMRSLPPKHPDRSLSHLVMGALSEALARADDAEGFYRQAYELRRDELPAAHPDLRLARLMWAKATLEMGRLEQAEELLAGAVDEARHANPAHPETLGLALQTVGDLAFRRGQLDEAAGRYAEALAVRGAALGTQHPDALASRRALGVTLRESGRFDDALRELNAVIAALEVTMPPGARLALEARVEGADAAVRAGRVAEAVTLLTPVLERLERADDWRSASHWARIVRRACAVQRAAHEHPADSEATASHANFVKWRERWEPVCERLANSPPG